MISFGDDTILFFQIYIYQIIKIYIYIYYECIYIMNVYIYYECIYIYMYWG